MFWQIFYWLVCLIFTIGGFAILFFGWEPTLKDVAWFACFAASMAAHARATQS